MTHPIAVGLLVIAAALVIVPAIIRMRPEESSRSVTQGFMDRAELATRCSAGISFAIPGVSLIVHRGCMGTKVVGDQQSHIANASVAHTLSASYNKTEIETALNALGTKLNVILTALRAHGLLASS